MKTDKQLSRKYEGRRVKLLVTGEIGICVDAYNGMLIVSVQKTNPQDKGYREASPDQVEFIQPDIFGFFAKPKYVQELFDPVQTHAVYGTNDDKEEITSVISKLKSIGATRFRVVKNDYGKAIVCFKYKPQK